MPFNGAQIYLITSFSLSAAVSDAQWPLECTVTLEVIGLHDVSNVPKYSLRGIYIVTLAMMSNPCAVNVVKTDSFGL